MIKKDVVGASDDNAARDNAGEQETNQHWNVDGALVAR